MEVLTVWLGAISGLLIVDELYSYQRPFTRRFDCCVMSGLVIVTGLLFATSLVLA